MKRPEALRKGNPSDLPSWFDEEFYRREISQRLSEFTVKKIRSRDVSHPYAMLIKRGERIPHPIPGIGSPERSCPGAEQAASQFVLGCLLLGKPRFPQQFHLNILDLQVSNR
jgi:hypothetical protein